MALFGSLGEVVAKGVNSGFSKLGSAFGVMNDMAGPNRFDETDAAKLKAQQDLLSKQKAAADMEAQSKIAGASYGSSSAFGAFGGANLQSQANKSGKKSILGGF